MEIGTQQKEVFRMVAIRSADADLVLDPTTDSQVEYTVARDFSLSVFEEENAVVTIRELIPEDSLWNLDQLRSDLPWNEITSIPDDADLREMSVNVSGSQIPYSEYATSSDFSASYSRLVDSWIGWKIRALGKFQEDLALLGEHENFIRTARAIATLADGTYTVDTLDKLKSTPVVVPTAWRKDRSTLAFEASGQSATFNKTKLKSTRRKLDLLNHEIDILERLIIQAITIRAEERKAKVPTMASLLNEYFLSVYDEELKKVPQTHSMNGFTLKTPLLQAVASEIGANGGSSPPPSDFKKLNAFLGEQKLPTSGSDVTAYPRIVDILEQTKLNKVREAASLTQELVIWEQATSSRLPPAKELGDDAPLSVRALGIGDLIVAREELVGYQAGEIAHIENVLPGESKVREQEQIDKNEVFLETESEESSFNEDTLTSTDRFELRNEATEALKTDFSIEAGVNTSGKYGLTKVDTSLDVDFSRSKSESRASATTTAQEVVSKAVERTESKTRELRRRTTSTTLRELTNHTIDNTRKDGQQEAPVAISGIYRWVEKIHRVEWRHYGSRLLVEFFVPEPGLSLLQQGEQQPEARAPKPAPLFFGPDDITIGNYKGLAKLYGAQGVEAPPPLIKQVGYQHSFEPKKEGQNKAEGAISGDIKIPDEYHPIAGKYAATGRATVGDGQEIDLFSCHISVAGEIVLDTNMQVTTDEIEAIDGGMTKAEKNRLRAQFMSYEGWFKLSDPLSVNDGLGVPVAVRFASHDQNTGVVNLYLICERSEEAFSNWQLSTFENIRNAHEAMVSDYESQLAVAEFEQNSDLFAISDRPSATNRKIEKDELKKWSIKLLRKVPFEFDAVSGYPQDDAHEIDPVDAAKQTPTVRFFEMLFEWEHMSYILHPYFWGRRNTWLMRQNISVPSDPDHEEFLRAGYARVIVPVNPGYESHLLRYLDPTVASEEVVGEFNAPLDPSSVYADLWADLMLDRNAELANGTGLLKVIEDSPTIEISDGSPSWLDKSIDIGREIYISGSQYTITEVNDNLRAFTVDRGYEGSTADEVRFLVGSVAYSEPWNIRLPTTLVVLDENTDNLNK